MAAHLLMRRQLAEPLALPPLPPGVRLVPLAEAEPARLHALLALAYAGGGGTVAADWWPALVADAEFDPQLCLVAMAGAEPVGLCQGWTSGFAKDLVVHPGWRRQGLGEALLARLLEALRARGLEQVDLKVERDNPSGAERLYRRMGFVPA